MSYAGLASHCPMGLGRGWINAIAPLVVLIYVNQSEARRRSFKDEQTAMFFFSRQFTSPLFAHSSIDQ